jgi:Pyruvate/2-oxoacid:ferredoxin oxidoreductase gamma subunit
MIKETGLVTLESATEAMKHVVSAKRASLLEANIKALQTGYNY